MLDFLSEMLREQMKAMANAALCHLATIAEPVSADVYHNGLAGTLLRFVTPRLGGFELRFDLQFAVPGDVINIWNDGSKLGGVFHYRFNGQASQDDPIITPVGLTRKLVLPGYSKFSMVADAAEPPGRTIDVWLERRVVWRQFENSAMYQDNLQR